MEGHGETILGMRKSSLSIHRLLPRWWIRQTVISRLPISDTITLAFLTNSRSTEKL